MHSILAVSELTLRESVRKKVFIAFAIFGVLLISSSAFFPTIDSVSRVRLVETWCIRATSTFGMLIVLFLAGVSIPSDIEDKKIFMFLSKPISRTGLVLGKFMGFCALAAAFLLATGLIGLLYIRIVAWTSPEADRQAVRNQLSARVAAVPEKFEMSLPSDVGPNLPEEARMTYSVGDGTLSNVTAFVSGPRQEGAPVYSVRWYFEGLPRQQELPERIQVQFKASVVADSYMAPARLMFINESERIFHDKRMDDLGHLRMVEFDVPRNVISADGRLVVVLESTSPDALVGVKPAGLQLLIDRGCFEMNYLKQLLVTFFQLVLIIAIMMMGSAVLSAPVNLFLGIFVYITGNLVGFLKESLKAVESTLRIASQVVEHGHGHSGTEEMPTWMLTYSKFVSSALLKVVPDFSKFDCSTPILKAYEVNWSVVGDAFFYMLAYIAAACLLACVFMRFKEFR